jgi:hypothetical protein
MKKAISYIVFTTLFLILGFWLRQYFFAVSISELKLNNIVLFTTSTTSQVNQNLIFCLTIGLIPSLYFVVDKLVKIKSFKQTLIILALIIIMGIIFWQLKILQLNNSFNAFSQYKLGNEIKNQFNFGDLNLGPYLAIGFMIGTVVSLLVFRKMNARHIE